MKNIRVSILISNFNRLNLLKRCLHSIARHKPNDCEVIIADDGSTDDIVKELNNFNSCFPWKFISLDQKAFTETTGITKFHNNPSWSNNVAFNNSSGERIFLMGNECIAWDSPFKTMLEQAQQCSNYHLILSKTYDVPQQILQWLDDYGANLTQNMVDYCGSWPLADENYKSDVTNYLSLTNRETWEMLQGYDERYLSGIACEDSDWIRRARTLPSFKLVRSNAVSLHQFHGGKTRYYEPTERGMTNEKWEVGLKVNREIYNNWDKTWENRQSWKPGHFIKDIVEHGYKI